MPERSDSGVVEGADPARVAVLGCGGIARQYHLPILRSDPRVDLVGAADPDPGARRAAASAGLLEPLDDPIALLDALRPAAVVVCAATPVHAELAVAVAERGMHLYLEKPVAIDRGGAEAVLAATSGSGAVSQIGFNLRFHPRLLELRRLLAEGAVGEPTGARATLIEKAPERGLPEWRRRRETGGGVLLDLGSHVLDLARWLFGAEIGEVSAAAAVPGPAAYDGARLSVSLGSGLPLDVELGLGPAAVHRWEIEGSEGALRFDAWPPRVSRGLRHPPGWGLSRRVRAALPIPRREPSFAPALGAFVTAVAGGDPGPRPSIADGVASLRAVLAAEAAAGLS